MKQYILPSLVLPLILVAALVHAFLKNTYISSYGKINYPFFLQFHTGATEFDITEPVYEWIPVHPYLKYAFFDEGYAHFNDDGTVTPLKGHSYSMEYATTKNVTVYGFRDRSLDIWSSVPDAIPIFQLSVIDNIESINYNQLKLYISGLSQWLKTYDKQNLLIIGGEFNFPEGMDGWGFIENINGTIINSKVEPKDYNRAMKLARQVIDTEHIDNIFLATHANILDMIYINGQWIRQDWLTEFKGLEEYYEGMREAHVLGFSFFYNLDELDLAWERVKVIRDAIGGEKPVIFLEYANKIWWEPYSICTAEFVEKSYYQLNKYKFVKGISWMLWPTYTTSDAFATIARYAEVWEGK